MKHKPEMDLKELPKTASLAQFTNLMRESPQQDVHRNTHLQTFHELHLNTLPTPQPAVVESVPSKKILEKVVLHMLGVQLGVSVLALRRAASRSDFLVIAICCPRALRSSDYIEHLGVRNLAPSMLAIVLPHDLVTHWHWHGRGSHEDCVAFLTHGDDIGIRRVQFHRSVCCQCQLLAAKQKDDLVIGIVYVASRSAS